MPATTTSRALNVLERRIGEPARRWVRHGRILPDLPLLPRWAAIGSRRPILMTGHVGGCRDRWALEWRGKKRLDGTGNRSHVYGVVAAGRLYWVTCMTFPVDKFDTGRPTT